MPGRSACDQRDRRDAREEVSSTLEGVEQVLRQWIVEIVRNDEFTFCESDWTELIAFGKRADLRYSTLPLVDDDRLAVKHTVKVLRRSVLDFL